MQHLRWSYIQGLLHSRWPNFQCLLSLHSRRVLRTPAVCPAFWSFSRAASAITAAPWFTAWGLQPPLGLDPRLFVQDFLLCPCSSLRMQLALETLENFEFHVLERLNCYLAYISLFSLFCVFLYFFPLPPCVKWVRLSPFCFCTHVCSAPSVFPSQ